MIEQLIAGVVPPGTHLRREVEARGWSQSDLAEILDRPIQAVNQILKGKKAITAATARELEDATSISAVTWLNLESQYRLALEARHDHLVAERAQLFSRAPVADLRRRGWVRNTKDIPKLRDDVLGLLRIKSISEPSGLRFAARKSTGYLSVSPEQESWCCQAFRLAESMKGISKFSMTRFEKGLPQLRELCSSAESVTSIPKTLCKLGVRFLIVEHLPRTKIDGATFWLSESQPVVVLSLRYGRIDHFLFTLFHELMHVLHRDALSLDNDILNEGGGPELPECEIRANREAGELLVPPDKIERFIARGKTGKADIVQFASAIGMHPGVVLGQLQHRGVVSWSACRDLLEPVRESILPLTVADGWGCKPGESM